MGGKEIIRVTHYLLSALTPLLLLPIGRHRCLARWPTCLLLACCLLLTSSWLACQCRGGGHPVKGTAAESIKYLKAEEGEVASDRGGLQRRGGGGRASKQAPHAAPRLAAISEQVSGAIVGESLLGRAHTAAALL